MEKNKVFYFYKVIALDIDERNNVEYFGVLIADSYADAARVIEENYQDVLVAIEYLEASDQDLVFTLNEDLYNRMYQELN